jgi:hypothetical protein
LSLSLPSPAALPVPALKPAAMVTADPAPLSDTPSPDRASEGARPDRIPDAAVAAPIPLLPAPGSAEVEKAAIPVRPGPGSGGLY